MIVRLCVLVCLAVLPASKAEVTVKNGSYHDLVISFSPNVDAENGKLLVDSLKNLLGDTSQVLHTAIGLRLSGVTFHLPSTWDTSTWEGVTVEPTSVLSEGEEDILVDDTVDSAFGKQPFALQYGGCGVPARRITVPVNFLNGTDGFPKGKLLAREWLKYRYGVFDENGHDGDDMYPSYYKIPGTVDAKITECTHPEVEYYFKDTEGNNCSLDIPFASSAKCEIHPKEDIAPNVTSSLMYYHQELKNMENICGKDHLHKDSTPSKQNVLCSGSSIWDVLEMSKDFNGTTDELQGDGEGIQFSYTQESKPRVVVAFEYSEILHDQRHLVLFALRRFMHALPDGSDFGLYSFNEQPIEIRPFSSLTSAAERDVTIPAEFSWNEDVCSTCALEKAVEALADKPHIQSSIILIVGSNSSGVDEGLVEKFNALNVCLKIIAFTSGGDKAVGYEELISSSSCNSIVELPKGNSDELNFEKLYSSLQESVSQSPTNIKISTINVGTMSNSNSIDIVMRQNAAKYTLWTARRLELSSVHCTAGSSSVTLNPSVLSNGISSYTFDPVEEEVTCKLRFPKSPAVFTQVEMTSKPGENIEGELWIHDPSESDEQMPVIIYARINFGSYPIQDAKVKAIVFGLDGKVTNLDLIDNGRGNPDITQHDGIYSRYFVDFTSEGEYQVFVTASDDGGQAKVGSKGEDNCCGSKVNSIQEQAPFFIHTFNTSFTAKKKPEGGFKPSRILDLRVTRFDPSNSIVLNWTAPGGEADKGNASSYEFLMFCNSKDCTENGQLPEWITFNNSIPTPNMSGEDEEVTFTFNSAAPNNQTVSFGLKSVNHNGQFSDMSNLVNVKLVDFSEPPTTTDPFEDKDNSVSKNVIRTIVGGSVLGLFLLICIAFVAHNSAKKIRGPRARDIPKSECINLGFSESTKDFKNIDTRDISLRRVESFPVVLYTHDQIRDFKNKKVKEPPLYKADVWPKPWTSLDALPRRLNKDGDDKSMNSVSTMPANGTNFSSNEMKQLDNTSQTSDIHLEKVAKF